MIHAEFRFSVIESRAINRITGCKSLCVDELVKV